jgi:hypothetical protein
MKGGIIKIRAIVLMIKIMPTIKYHKECNSPVEYDNNIYAACGDSECCGGYDEGYVCTKCRCVIDNEDIDEREVINE